MSSANKSGNPPATDADDAERQLGRHTPGAARLRPTPGPVPSTIIDCTDQTGRVLRLGALSLERINEVVAPLDAEIRDEG